MNEIDALNKVTELEKRVDELESTLKKAKKYLLIFIIISAVLFIVPLVGLLFAIPNFLDTYSEISNF